MHCVTWLVPRSSGNCVARTMPMSCQSSRNKSEERSKETDPAVPGLCIFSFICFKRAKKNQFVSSWNRIKFSYFNKKERKKCMCPQLWIVLFLYWSLYFCVLGFNDFGEKKFKGIFISEYSKNDHSKEMHVIWIFVCNCLMSMLFI